MRLRNAVGLVAIAGALAVASHGRWWQWPDRHNPWSPLQIDEPPGWLTHYKLQRLDETPLACLDLLSSAGLQFDHLPDREAGPGCKLRNVVQVRATRSQVGRPFVLSCRAAVSLALWERHVVMREAERLLGEPLQRLDHVGSFACRNVYGQAEGRRSQHASADALDVTGFQLRSGRRISVARDWSRGDAAGQFLHSVHAGACPFFDGVLGPDYNAAHADHLHLDRGPYRICR